MAAASLAGDSPDTALSVMSEPELAAMRAAEGDPVVQHGGCHWRSSFPGFYQPIHLLARLRAAELRQPAPLCWGFRAALAEQDAPLADASLPLHLLTDLPHFGERTLSRNRRSDLRRCRRQVELRCLTGPGLLLEQGHAVFMSAVGRLGHWRALSELEYRQRVSRRAAHGRRLVVAGLVDGTLCGYLDSYAVDGVLHTDEIFVASDALRTGIGTGLYVEVILAAARQGLRAVCNGLHRPEDANLCHFKESLGFGVVKLPARTVMPAPIRAWLRVRRPATYYRLTGDGENRVPNACCAP
jgi:L-amino acid N-acyltransferase YncA